MLSPKVTVLMAVYNGERYLREAVGSVLDQSFEDFEFLVVDDGSTDGSATLVEAFGDPRIRLVRNGENIGLAASLNRGLEFARGKYVARMDADDISLPNRLVQQVTFLEKHPEVGVCGSWIRCAGDQERKIIRYPTDPEVIRAGFLFDPMVAHPSVMFRRELFLQHCLSYNPTFQRAQDYELWARAVLKTLFSNVPEVLLLYRVHPAQVRTLYHEDQQNGARRVRLSLLAVLGIEPTDEEIVTHQALATCCIGDDLTVFDLADRWLCRIREANDLCNVYDCKALDQVLVERWITFLKKGVAETNSWGELLRRRAILKRVRGSWGYIMRFLLAELITRLKG